MSTGLAASQPPAGRRSADLTRARRLLQADRPVWWSKAPALSALTALSGAAEGGDHRHRRLRTVLGNVADDPRPSPSGRRMSVRQS